MRFASVALLAMVAGCCDPPPPAPPPAPFIPIPPLTEPKQLVSAPPPREEAPPKPPEPPPQPALHVVLELPYKLGRPPPPTSREAYRADILEQRRWNDGGLGDDVGELPPPEGHPDPRVIIDVERARGGHSQKLMQQRARKDYWMSIVRCYRLGAYKDPELRGYTWARIDVRRDGRVRGARMLRTELEDRNVAQCIVDKLRAFSFSPARRGTTAWLAMRVGPGDDPMPPPDELLDPGDGALPGEAMRRGTEAGIPEFEGCYRDALGYAPGLWGRIVLRFHVTARGRLDEAFEGGSRFPDKRMLQCVLRAARRLSFEVPKGGDLRFVVPVRFWTDRAAVRD